MPIVTLSGTSSPFGHIGFRLQPERGIIPHLVTEKISGTDVYEPVLINHFGGLGALSGIPRGPNSIKLVMLVAFRQLKKYPYQRIFRTCKVRQSLHFYEKSEILFKNNYFIFL
jgi:hypothetical protein